MKAETLDTLIRALKQHPGGTAKVIAASLGWKVNGTSTMLGRLHDQGFARRELRDYLPSPANREYHYWFTPKPIAAVMPDRRDPLRSSATREAEMRRLGQQADALAEREFMA